MNSKSLSTLGIATAVVAALAAVVVVVRGGPSSASESDAAASSLFFPDLAQHVNDVAAIEVANADGAFEVEKEDDGWGMPSKGGFPVDFSKVKEVVVAMSQLEKLEAKTKNPENFSKLGLEDVGEPESKSTRVVLKDASGATLAALLVGNTHPRKSGAGKPSLYVREPDSEQAWQVTGRVWVEPTASNWLEKTICEIGRERIAKVVTTHPDGETLVVSKNAPEDTDWTVEGVPEGRELSWAGVGGSIAGAVSRLMLQDVKPAEEVDFSQAPNTVTEYSTWDGLVLTVRVMDTDDQSYLKLSAAYDPSLRPQEPIGPEPEPAETAGEDSGDQGAGETAETAEAESKDSEAEDKGPLGKSEEEVTAEVAELNERFAGWVYVVPGYQASNFEKHMEDLLKKLPEPEDKAPEGAGDTGTAGGAEASLDDLFPDGLPPELEGVDFGEKTETPKLGDMLGTDSGEPLDEPKPNAGEPPPAATGDSKAQDSGSPEDSGDEEPPDSREP